MFGRAHADRLGRAVPESVIALPSKHPTREKILDAAEALFAAHSFNGVSMRQIAEEAGVGLSLVAYHAGSKEELFRKVIARRIAPLSDARREALEGALGEAGGKPLSVEAVVEAFVGPYVAHSLGGGPGWKNYARLVARMTSSPQWLDVISDLFDPVAQLFLNELARSLPGASQEHLHWGFHFMVVVMTGTMAENGRIDRLSGGQFRSDNIEQARRYMVPFIAAGLRSMSAG